MRLLLRDEGQGLAPAAGQADHLQIGLVSQNGGQPLAHDGVIVGDDKANGTGGG